MKIKWICFLMLLLGLGSLLECTAYAAVARPKTSYCTLYGYSGNTQNTKSCVDGPSSRTITCATGFVVAGGKSNSIMLIGDTKFRGCVRP